MGVFGAACADIGRSASNAARGGAARGRGGAAADATPDAAGQWSALAPRLGHPRASPRLGPPRGAERESRLECARDARRRHWSKSCHVGRVRLRYLTSNWSIWLSASTPLIMHSIRRRSIDKEERVEESGISDHLKLVSYITQNYVKSQLIKQFYCA